MTKRKKRNAVTLVSLLLALGVLIGLYVWYNNRDVKSEETEDDTQTIALGTLDTEQISTLHFIGSDVDMTLALEDGIWKSKEEPDRPIKQDNVTSLINKIKDISAKRIVTETADNLADFGLDKPAYYLQATKKDGGTVTLQIGNEIPTGGGYYALVNEDKKVYLLDTTYGTGLQFSNADMTEVADGPSITAENIYHVDIMNRDGEDYELKVNQDGGLDNSGSDMYSWEILKPYGKGFTADTSKVSELMANYTTFDFNSCVDYKGEALSQYGLDDPAASVYIGYYETSTEKLDKPEVNPDTGEEVTEKTVNTEKEFKIFIGKEDGSGNRYVRKDGTNEVYTMNAETIDKMLTIDTFSIINPYVAIPNLEAVDKITADIGGETYTMEIKRSSKKNDDGEEETQATYYYNGKEVEEELFKSVYQKLIGVRYDADSKEAVTSGKDNPVMTISYHIQGDNETTITISYLPYDDSFYIADKGTGVNFFVDKRTIDDLAETVKTFSVTE
jgi:hypothetical protein